MFEQASRMRLRFNSNKGDLSVEDLWDLPLTVTERQRGTSLDIIARTVSSELKSSEEESFVVISAVSVTNSTLQLKLDILKHIIAVKLEEKKTAANDTAKRLQKQKILAIIAQKKDDALLNLSEDGLQKLLDDM